MQTPNAQGIAGLMSQGRAPQPPQQQQAAPSPMKASPMASIGSVEDRVAAYRGNPAPLQQRYAMSQDLLDLLALQQIKSEKENAARQMQMQMAQQQAAQGAGEMTIAQQREKEVMELTKNELAQQRGETAQQQVGEQQANLQKVMSGGIARAPGAQTVAQPKMMAAGGIAAFTTGGDVDPKLAKEAERRAQRYAAGRRLGRGRAGQLASAAARGAAGVAGVPVAIAAGLTSAMEEMRDQGYPGDPAGEFSTGAMTPEQAAFDENRRQRLLQGQAAQRAEDARLNAAVEGRPPRAPINDRDNVFTGPMTAVAPATPGAGGPAAAGARPGAGGPAATSPRPPAGPAAPAAPTDIAFQKPTMADVPALVKPTMDTVTPVAGLKDSIQQDLQRDPLAMQREQEDRIRRMYDLTPEQRKVYEEGIAQRRQMFDEAYNPERMRREGIKQFLLGAGGRRYNVFGGGAKAATAYDEGARAQRRKDFEDLQKSREGLIALERAGIAPSIEGGLKGLEAGSALRRQGQASGANVLGTESSAATSKFSTLGSLASNEYAANKSAASSQYSSDTSAANTQYSAQMQARTAALDRQVNQLKVNAQAEANKIAREGLSFDRARTLYATTTERLQKLEKDYQEAFNEQNFDLLMAERSGKATPEQKKQLETARVQLERMKAEKRRELEPVLAPIRRQLGGAASANMSPADQALVDKFLNKGQ